MKDRVEPLSQAVEVQLVVSGFLLLCLILPLALRKALLLTFVPAAIIVAVHEQLVALMLGDYSFSDVTLAERGYETEQVFGVLGGAHEFLTILLGAGPAATVNLTLAPDRATLSAAGRSLAAVDDVHLLTSYLLLKFGLVGLLFLGCLFGCVGRLAWRVVATAAKPEPFDVLLLLFPAAAIVAALPAATDLFANPLMGLFVGVLFSRCVTSST